jgi:poly(ADP-ribose) glycohydrolase ARH3
MLWFVKQARIMADLRGKYLGGMIGSALGDAIGELAFFHPHKETLCAHLEKLETYRYTDDTAMSIGIAESVVKTGCLDEQDLGETFRANFKCEPWRGYAPGPPTVFSMVEELGIAYAEAAQRLFGGSGSFGNGSAMRVVPVGLVFHDSPDLYEMARVSAVVTHAHPLGIDGAAVQSKAVALAVQHDPEDTFPYDEFVQDLLGLVRTPQMREKIREVVDLISSCVDPSVAAQRLGRTVAVHESLPFALYSFLRYPKSFEDCLFCAILNGGDRDTLGAMACAISGAYLGIKAIPKFWIDKLENRKYIEALASRLLEVKPIS